jgi:hypothetical protein
MAMSTAEKLIIEDNNLANRATAIYMQGVNDEMFARGHHLVIAVTKFSTFLGLKELPKKFDIYLSLAASFLPMVCPELFLAKWLGDSEEAVKRALAVSSALGDKRAKAVNLVQKGKEAATKVAEMNERRKGRAENLAKLEEMPGAKQIAQLDAAEVVVNELIGVSRRAFAVWQDATLAVATEFSKRLDNPQHKTSESLESMAKRLLPLPPALTNDELQQVEKVYLYQIIASWAGANITLDDDVDDWTADGGEKQHHVHRHGLNDNQAETLVAWFGVQAPRGKIFNLPPILDVNRQLQVWGAPMSTRTHMRFYKGHNI